MNAASTIYALASAPGKAGVAVVRISGPDTRKAAEMLGVASMPEPRTATLAELSHGGNVIDRALVLWFPAPNSFTGEDVLELHLHGSKAVLKVLFSAFGASPLLRLAEPGEFARRAFQNGKMDLAQAEGLADLIDAETGAQHKQALRQLGGEASTRLAALRSTILAPLALLEAYIDFPDEEIPEGVIAEAKNGVAKASAEIAALLDDGAVGEKIRQGIEIVIFGPPNAGKSTLINRLAQRELAIVSPEPGTTRDAIETHLDIGGYEVTLVDTAGLREAQGIEKEGIRRAEQRVAHADFKLCVVSADAATQQIEQLQGQIDNDTIIIINKTDIYEVSAIPEKALLASLKTGKGVDALIAALKIRIEQSMAAHPSPLITRTRHREALQSAQTTLARCDFTQPLELTCEELRMAARDIGKITGHILVDDVLDLVFSRFCIGK